MFFFNYHIFQKFFFLHTVLNRGYLIRLLIGLRSERKYSRMLLARKSRRLKRVPIIYSWKCIGSLMNIIKLAVTGLIIIKRMYILYILPIHIIEFIIVNYGVIG